MVVAAARPCAQARMSESARARTRYSNRIKRTNMPITFHCVIAMVEARRKKKFRTIKLNFMSSEPSGLICNQNKKILLPTPRIYIALRMKGDEQRWHSQPSQSQMPHASRCRHTAQGVLMLKVLTIKCFIN